MWTKIIYIFIGLVFLKILYNTYYFLLARKFLSKYEDYFLRDPKSWYIRDNQQRIIAILLKANIKDNFLPFAEPVGFGYLQAGQISVFNNLALRRDDVIQNVYSMIREAKTIFKSRIIDSFNPLCWLETFIYIPKIVLQYFSIDTNSILIKIALILWWMLNLISIVVGILFNKEFMFWLKSL